MSYFVATKKSSTFSLASKNFFQHPHEEPTPLLWYFWHMIFAVPHRGQVHVERAAGVEPLLAVAALEHRWLAHFGIIPFSPFERASPAL